MARTQAGRRQGQELRLGDTEGKVLGHAKSDSPEEAKDEDPGKHQG